MAVCLPIFAYAAGSSATFTPIQDGDKTNAFRMVIDWTSDDSTGEVAQTISASDMAFLAGKLLLGVWTAPGTSAPTDLYDIEILELESAVATTGNDILGDSTHPGHDRSSTLKQYISPEVTTTTAGTSQYPYQFKNKYYRLSITNAGNSKQGTVELILRR
jgi:hypothetical protein